VSKFHVNSLSTVYPCAKHNLPTLIELVQAHEQMGLEGGGVWVSGPV